MGSSPFRLQGTDLLPSLILPRLSLEIAVSPGSKQGFLGNVSPTPNGLWGKRSCHWELHEYCEHIQAKLFLTPLAIPTLEELPVLGLLSAFVFESFRWFMSYLGGSLVTWTEERLFCLPLLIPK